MFTFPVGFFGGSIGDPYWSNVVLYLPLTGTNGQTTFTDVSQYGHTVTRNGDTVISTAQAPALTGVNSSLYLDGSGDYLSIANNTAFQLGTGDFTVRFFWRGSAVGSYTMIVGTLLSNFNQANTWRIGNRFNSLNSTYFARTTGSGVQEPVYSTNINDGNWHYVLVRRISGTISYFVDGNQLTPSSGSESIPEDLTTNNELRIGYNQLDSAYVQGYLSHLQIYKGVGIAGTSVPTAPFPIG